MVKIDLVAEDFGENGLKITFPLCAIRERFQIYFKNIFEMENFYRFRRDIEKDEKKVAEYEEIRALLEAAAIANAKLEKKEYTEGELVVYLMFSSEEQKKNFKENMGQLTEQANEM